MEKCGLMKEIDKWSSTIKSWRKARSISQNTLNERSRANNKGGEDEAYKSEMKPRTSIEIGTSVVEEEEKRAP